MEAKEQAAILRAEGNTYPKIVELLDGQVSLDWCKRNLKNVQKETKKETLDRKARELAIRREGVSDRELVNLAFEVLGTVEKGDITKLKRRIKRRGKQDKTMLVRPSWLSTQNPVGSLHTMNTLAHTLYEYTQEMVDDYMSAYPEANRFKVLQELVYLANGWTLKESLDTRLERNIRTAEEMQSRL
jgi:hypothetical protein